MLIFSDFFFSMLNSHYGGHDTIVLRSFNIIFMKTK